MKKYTLIFFCLLILSACYPTGNSDIALTVTATLAPKTMAMSTSIVATKISANQTVAPTGITLRINESCVKSIQSSPTNLNGTLVFQKDFGGPLYFSNLMTGGKRIVPENPKENVWSAYVSPNGRRIIYQKEPLNSHGEFEFVLAESNGIDEKEMPFGDGDWDVSSIFWLNNDVLRVAEPDNAYTYINNFAFDPFTGTKTPLLSDFPGLAGKGEIDWGVDDNVSELGITKGLNLIYDPTLTKVVYPRIDGYASLFDLEKNQEIARLSAPGRGRLPKWSPDGKQVAIIGTESNSNGSTSDGFLIASNDGSHVERIIMPLSTGNNILIEDYSWSPDGKRIALWLETDDKKFTSTQNPFELAVIDLENNEMTKYCVSGTSTIDQEGYIAKISVIWSPDTTKLLVTQYNNENKTSTAELIVDLEETTSYKVADNMRPIGWMVNEP